MKKTLSTIVLASALLLGTVAPVAANADTTDPTSTGNTATHVQIDAPANMTNPVDPTDPSNPATNTDPTDSTSPSNPADNGAKVSGPLTFLYVTKDMTFEETTSSISKAQTIPVKTITESTFMKDGTPNANFVTEVGDSRGTNAGWSVQVQSSQMTNASKDVLKGATVDFGTGVAGTNNGDTTITNSADNAGITANNVSLATDGATNAPATIYTAAADHGAGATAFQLGTDKIALNNVAPNAKSGTYNGNLTWSLSNTPTSSDSIK
ncbi:WxL domain-containing protein [Levilactobacillus wangkuiensis]|uniref:WxL domain-containing protein n=1 Tax=Levilactobacillus wangkuiensis TaxID=2799566 RepID=UPI001941655B|nr:WxL domain-containing protein [Levilactobacillus wangkuiensis]